MLQRLEELLAELESCIDPAEEARIARLHRMSLSYETVERLPLVMSYPIPQDARFLPFPHGRIYRDPDIMLFNELVSAFDTSIAYRREVSDDLPVTIRPNFGTVLVASVLGGRIEQVGDNRPWVRHFETDREYRGIFDTDLESAAPGWMPRVVEFYERAHEILADYPRLASCAKLVLPDLQGPIDVLEQLRGGELFTDFFTDPNTLKRGLELAARAVASARRRLVPFTADGPEGFTHQHAAMIAGHLLIRDDSAVMISPQMYREFVLPCDAALLEEVGGGGIHSCGKIEHDFDLFLSMPALRCIDLGQPEMNDRDALYAKAKRRKVALVRMRISEDEITSASVNRRFPTGVSLVHVAGSLDEARRIMNSYRNASQRGGA